MSDAIKTTCPACGGNDLTHGVLTTGPYGGAVKFAEKTKYYTVTSRDAIQARRCNGCGDVQMFVGIPKSTSSKPT